MTREQKLALVLGFAAVLVVGLLISDHLAASRSTSLERAPHDASVVIDATEGQALRRVVTLPEASTELAKGSAGEPAAETRADPALGGREPRQTYRGRPARRLAQAQEAQAQYAQVTESEASRAEIDSPAQEPIRFVLGSEGGIQEPAGGESILESLGDRVASGAEAMARGIRDLTGVAAATPFNGLAQLDEAPGTPVSREASTRPTVVQHHVQANESLYKIAERYYGDGNKWRRIAKDNPDRVGSNGSVREGVMLRVFDPTRGAVVASAGQEPSRAIDPQRAATRRGPPTYTVQAGDTLGEISQKLLGTIRRQHELVALNRDVLSDPDQLRAGMVLKLPSS